MKNYNIVMIGVFLIICLVAVSACTDKSSSIVSGANQGKLNAQNTISTYVATPTESQIDRNIRIANEIVANYHKTHIYTLNDLYVCGDMASDIWDMLKTQGINAKINIGNIDKDITKIGDANHAWVLAEVAPNSYLALEATGGYSVKNTDNPRYYVGWSFYNPKQLKNYLQLNTQRNDAVNKYNSALNDYNNYVDQYNKAGIISRVSMKSILDDKQLILNQRTADLNQINQQITSLLSNL